MNTKKLFEKKNDFTNKLLRTLSCFPENDFSNPEISLDEYSTAYRRIFFNFLLLIIIFLCGFLGLYGAGGRYFREDENFPVFFGSSILAVSLIFVIYNFTNKNPEVVNTLYYIYNIFTDIYLGILIYDTNTSSKSLVFFLRILYFYFLSATIFILFRFETTTTELVIFLIYKSVIFFMLLFTNTQSFRYLDFIYDFGFLIFWVISIFIYVLLRQDFKNTSVEFFYDQMSQNKYYQSLINMINKSFLSLNINNFSLKFNESFENLIKSLGINEIDIEYYLKSTTNSGNLNFNQENKNDSNSNPPNLFSRDNQVIQMSYQSQDFTNTQVTPLNNTDLNIIKNTENKAIKITDGKKYTNLNKLRNSDLNVNSDSKIYKNNMIINPRNMNLNKTDQVILNNSSSPIIDKDKISQKVLNKIITSKTTKFLKENTEENSFYKKLDFILTEILVNFYEENNISKNNISKNNKNSSKGNEVIYTKSNMSDAITEIFNSRFNLSINDEFIFKGVYSTLPKLKTNITIELYYRKVLTFQGEVIEFYFNDITSTRKLESEKALNRIRSLILAKVFNEFKTPLISIILILKNYFSNEKIIRLNTNNIKKINDRENDQINIDDYFRNTIDLTDYMLSLTNDIFEYSVINSEFDFKCEYENFDLREMLEYNFSILKILLKCKGLSGSVQGILEIDQNIPQQLCNDEKRVKQILLNLITNSLKYTKRGYIKISVNLLIDESIKISVEDTGSGIESQILQNLFKDICSKEIVDSSEKVLTSGLGLSISKKIIDKIGEKIECYSIPNQLTVFNFVISSKDISENDKTINISYVEDLQLNKSAFSGSSTPNFVTNITFNNGKNNILNNDDIQSIKNNSNVTKFIPIGKNEINKKSKIFGKEDDVNIQKTPKNIKTNSVFVTKNTNNKNFQIFNSVINDLSIYIKPILKYFKSTKNNIILYVSDNEILRKSIRKQIISYIDLNNVDVIACRDGIEAFYLIYLDQFTNNKIKSVISIDKMNLIDGSELNELLQKYSNLKKLKKIQLAISMNNNQDLEELKKVSENLFSISQTPKKNEIVQLLQVSKIIK